jgi:hypothetical protein
MAWEMGSGWGHVGRLVPLTRAFRARGWRVTLALKQLGLARHWFGADAALVQAPRVPVDRELILPTLNASSLLSEGGWLDARSLRGLLRGWQRLLAHLRPDLLLCDYAPAAMLAGRQRPGLAAFHVGSNFGPFATGDPMPPLRWWDQADERVLADCREHDELVLSVVNKVLRSLRWPPLSKPGDLWPEETSILCSVPPLDHGAKYGRPRRCWGVLENSVVGVRPPVWPAAGGDKVFAYLKPRASHAERILQAVASLGLNCLVVMPNAPRDLVERFRSDHLAFSPPVDIPAAMRQASLAVGNGTHGMCAVALAAGVPLLMSPYVLEQRLNAVAVQEAGAGLVVDKKASAEEIAVQIRSLLHETSFRRAARACARSDWAMRTSAEAAGAIADHCIGAAAITARE